VFKKLIFLLLLFLFVLPNYSYAHVTESVGSIFVLIHVFPDDKPVAGVETQIGLDIRDESNKFTMNDCDCIAKVMYLGDEIFKTTLYDGGPGPIYSMNFSTIFPKKGVYQIEVEGKSKTGSFESFKVSYDIRVENSENDFKTWTYDVSNGGPSTSNLTLAIGAGFAILIVVFLIFFMSKHKKKRW
jgi:hypothetical protein